MFERYMEALNKKVDQSCVSREDLQVLRVKLGDKIDDLEEKSISSRSLLKNHTEHITSVKSRLDNYVGFRQFDELEKKTKLLATNSELQKLYNLVVPPAQEM